MVENARREFRVENLSENSMKFAGKVSKFGGGECWMYSVHPAYLCPTTKEGRWDAGKVGKGPIGRVWANEKSGVQGENLER